MQIDPRDYEVALAAAEAEVVRAEQALTEERARAAQAERDWTRLGDGGPAPDLVSRQPQLAAATAAVAAARANVNRARLDLERTVVRAPYAGRMRTRQADLGQVVAPNTVLADIYATDAVEVALPLKPRDLPYLELPEARARRGAPPSVVELRASLPPHARWEATLTRTEGAIDESTRQLRVVAQIAQPYATGAAVEALRIGEYVTAYITGRELDAAIVVPADALYEARYVYVVAAGVLARRPVEVAWRNADEVSSPPASPPARPWSSPRSAGCRRARRHGWSRRTRQHPRRRPGHPMIAWFARHDVAANLLMVTIVLGGLIALKTRIPLEIFPDLQFDVVTIRVALRGAAPADVEQGVAIRLEEAVQDLQGIRRLTSQSTEGSAVVALELATGADARRLLEEVKVRVDALNTLPAAAEKPVIELAERRREVLTVAVAGEFDEMELREFAEQVRDDLLRDPGISQAILDGVRAYEIAIEADLDSLRSHGLDLDAIAAAVAASSLDLSAGNLRTRGGDVLVRSQGQAYARAAFENIVIRTGTDGSILHLGDVATVHDAFEELPLRTRLRPAGGNGRGLPYRPAARARCRRAGAGLYRVAPG